MIGAAGFDETLVLLNDLYRKPRVPAEEAGLRRIEYLMKRIGDPHRNFRSVHVTGSCGKGSTTTMIGSILQAAGFRTGYFRSPHLHSYPERIAIDGKEIPVEAWYDCFRRIWPVVEEMQESKNSEYDLGRPTLFEVLFALMALYFAENSVEWAAVETGLGGRLDATNTLKSDVAVVTNVSLEHTKVLGNDVQTIAREKAAIIKEGTSAVTAADDPVALAIIEAQTRSTGSLLWEVGRDVTARVLSENLYGQTVLLGLGLETLQIELPIAGEFQATNAATALAAAEALKNRGIEIDDDSVRAGLSAVRMPGRFEVVQKEPLVIVDGAHSPAGARALAATMRRLGLRDVDMLFGAQADKDVVGMAEHLGPLIGTLVLTQVPESERSAKPSNLRAAFEPFVEAIVVEEDVHKALESVQQESARSSTVVITGSLYLVGYCRTQLARTLVTT